MRCHTVAQARDEGQPVGFLAIYFFIFSISFTFLAQLLERLGLLIDLLPVTRAVTLKTMETCNQRVSACSFEIPAVVAMEIRSTEMIDEFPENILLGSLLCNFKRMWFYTHTQWL